MGHSAPPSPPSPASGRHGLAVGFSRLQQQSPILRHRTRWLVFTNTCSQSSYLRMRTHGAASQSQNRNTSPQQGLLVASQYASRYRRRSDTELGIWPPLRKPTSRLLCHQGWPRAVRRPVSGPQLRERLRPLPSSGWLCVPHAACLAQEPPLRHPGPGTPHVLPALACPLPGFSGTTKNPSEPKGPWGTNTPVFQSQGLLPRKRNAGA